MSESARETGITGKHKDLCGATPRVPPVRQDHEKNKEFHKRRKEFGGEITSPGGEGSAA